MRKDLVGKEGWWATHKYSRRNTDNVAYFCGWDALKSFFKKISKIKKSSRRVVLRALMAILFLTGCRANEVLTLNVDLFDINDDRVLIKGMDVLKKRENKGKTRVVGIKRNEPLVNVMVGYIDMVKEKKKCLPERVRRGGGYLFPYKYGWVYKWVREIDKRWWPHRFRIERACQLAVEYNYNALQLIQWFGWDEMSYDVAAHYVRMDVEHLLKAMQRGEL